MGIFDGEFPEPENPANGKKKESSGSKGLLKVGSSSQVTAESTQALKSHGSAKSGASGEQSASRSSRARIATAAPSPSESPLANDERETAPTADKKGNAPPQHGKSALSALYPQAVNGTHSTKKLLKRFKDQGKLERPGWTPYKDWHDNLHRAWHKALSPLALNTQRLFNPSQNASRWKISNLDIGELYRLRDLKAVLMQGYLEGVYKDFGAEDLGESRTRTQKHRHEFQTKLLASQEKEHKNGSLLEKKDGALPSKKESTTGPWDSEVVRDILLYPNYRTNIPPVTASTKNVAEDAQFDEKIDIDAVGHSEAGGVHSEPGAVHEPVAPAHTYSPAQIDLVILRIEHMAQTIGHVNEVLNYTIHAAILFPVLTEVIFTRHRWNLHRLVLIVPYMLIYVFFNLAAAAATGRPIYCILDWRNNPRQACVWSAAVILLIIMMYVACRFVCKWRDNCVCARRM